MLFLFLNLVPFRLVHYRMVLVLCIQSFLNGLLTVIPTIILHLTLLCLPNDVSRMLSFSSWFYPFVTFPGFTLDIPWIMTPLLLFSVHGMDLSTGLLLLTGSSFPAYLSPFSSGGGGHQQD